MLERVPTQGDPPRSHEGVLRSGRGRMEIPGARGAVPERTEPATSTRAAPPRQGGPRPAGRARSHLRPAARGRWPGILSGARGVPAQPRPLLCSRFLPKASSQVSLHSPADPGHGTLLPVPSPRAPPSDQVAQQEAAASHAAGEFRLAAPGPSEEQSVKNVLPVTRHSYRIAARSRPQRACQAEGRGHCGPPPAFARPPRPGRAQAAAGLAAGVPRRIGEPRLSPEAGKGPLPHRGPSAMALV